jgi:predicted RNA-binding Zn-ribbon protein involved in translation (DUF1610 family)
MQGLTLNEGKEHLVNKDGTFHLDEATGKTLVKSGDFAQVGINFQKVSGHACPECGRMNIFRDSCGRCGWHQ